MPIRSDRDARVENCLHFARVKKSGGGEGRQKICCKYESSSVGKKKLLFLVLLRSISSNSNRDDFAGAKSAPRRNRLPIHGRFASEGLPSEGRQGGLARGTAIDTAVEMPRGRGKIYDVGASTRTSQFRDGAGVTGAMLGLARRVGLFSLPFVARRADGKGRAR